MKVFRFVLTAAVLLPGSVQAQALPEPLPPTLQPQAPAGSAALDRSFQPFPRTYGSNRAALHNEQLHKGFRTDARLVGGAELAPSLALEAGYVPGFDRGFHAIHEGRPDEVAGALAVGGFSTHLAGKASLPLSERLSVYGKLGVAHSGRKMDGIRVTDTGIYSGAGGQYKLGENAGIDAEYGRHGNAVSKWGNRTNADAVRASVKLGF